MKKETTYRNVTLIALLITLAAAALLIFFFFSKQKVQLPEEKDPLEENRFDRQLESTVLEEDIPQEVFEGLPDSLTLNDSDDWLQGQAQDLSGNDDFQSWLNNKDLLRRFVAVVNNIAAGESPAAHLDFLRPKQPFTTRRENGEIFLDPDSYRRYDFIGTALKSLNFDRALLLYRRSRPLLQEAHLELGHQESDFHAVLLRAIEQILKTPLPTLPIRLEEQILSYGFADPSLEELNPAQKHFLRLGPDNLKTWQNFLAKVKESLQ